MTNQEILDTTYMRRALQLAALGAGSVSPNPMVGAVITARGRIIGEGWHRRWGGPHAEVNAVASVAEADLPLLPESTIYVTLEPCSHYGKTPPCSLLLIEKGIRRIVVGTTDPNPLVAGRGLRMLREAGREVITGVLEEECRELNKRFMTFQTRKRPWVQLKYAVSADGIIGSPADAGRLLISSPLSSVWMHRERAMADAIMTGTRTVKLDNPRLDCRLWPGRKPAGISFESAADCKESNLMKHRHILKHDSESLEDFLHRIAGEGISALMVEGGRQTLQSFLDAGLFDEVRIEAASRKALPQESTDPLPDGWTTAPLLPPGLILKKTETCGSNHIFTLAPGREDEKIR